LRFLTTVLITASLFQAGVAFGLQETAANPQAPPDETAGLRALAADFFEWRRLQQPASGDDIPRVERPDGWVPDFSPDALDAYRQRYQDYFSAIEKIDTTGWPVSARVDARLLRAAVQRVHWELDVLQAPQRNPLFYVQQTLGSVF
jgi:hypothetical protein